MLATRLDHRLGFSLRLRASCKVVPTRARPPMATMAVRLRCEEEDIGFIVFLLSFSVQFTDVLNQTHMTGNFPEDYKFVREEN